MSYLLTPHAVAAPFMPTVVALAAGVTKTVAQVATPSTTDIVLYGWFLSFDGTSGSAVPVTAQLATTGAVAASGLTAQAADVWSHDQETASLCVSGAALTGHGGGVTPTEGTITAIRVLDQQLVHPQSGYSVIWAEGDRLRVPVSTFLRIRCNAPAAVDVIPGIIWDEPAR